MPINKVSPKNIRQEIYAFRVDASLEIGNGHVMRCLTLAQKLRASVNGICIFLCKDLAGNLIDEIKKNGFQTFCLTQFNQNILTKKEPAWEDDAAQTIAYIEKIKPKWLIVDHYDIDSAWELKLYPYCSNLMVIDDLANRQHYCDLLLDQNLGRKSLDYKNLLIKETSLLIGPQYALLRDEFQSQRIFSINRKRELKKILISVGGVDKENITKQILNSLNSCNLPNNIEITVILGENCPWIKQIIEISKEMKWKTTTIINCKNMAEELALTDLAIGAAGTTSWERCCLGVPSIIFCTADNQRMIAKYLEEIGAASLMKVEIIKNEFDIFFEDLDSFHMKLDKMSYRAAQITDGLGASIIVNHMNQKPPYKMR